MTFRLQLSQDLSGKLVIPSLHRLGCSLQAGTRRIEELDGFVAQGFVERIAKFARAGEAMPGLLRHSFMHHASDRLTHRRVDVGSRRRNLPANGLNDLVGSGALERMPSSKGLVGDNAQ